ncbi:MAG: hypothetical protein M3R15_08955 [Acidobacteriota bacterium]|nr:hypothetical protein [Acidobacteriota bacterium]
MKSYSYNLFADYHQFYLQDEQADGDLSDSWSEEAVKNLLAVAPGTIGVGTVRNTDVPVVVELLASEPKEDLSKWNHVMECGIDVPSGRIAIAGSTDYFPEAERIVVQPGSYRARIFYGALSESPEINARINL